MKKFAISAVLFLTIVAACAGMVAATRYLSSVTTRVDVIHPKPGVECIMASTSDGAAISCNWGQK